MAQKFTSEEHFMKKLFIAVLAFVSVFAGCGPDGKGNFRVLVTDAPFPYETVASATVTLDAIEVRGTNGFQPVLLTPKTIDLVQLRNGVTAELLELDLPAGDYDQVRLVVSKGEVTMKDGRVFELKVPSGDSSGLKINIKPALHVETSLSTDLLLDFDLSRSFVAQSSGNGNVTGFHFKPVVRVSNMTTAGTLSGIVVSDNGTAADLLDDVALAGALVTVSQNGEELASTVTEADGHYSMIGLPAGGYDLTVTALDHADAARSTVVVLGNVTTENVTLSK